jgi:hypothetical protein
MTAWPFFDTDTALTFAELPGGVIEGYESPDDSLLAHRTS